MFHRRTLRGAVQRPFAAAAGAGDYSTGLIANWQMQLISGGTTLVDSVGTLGVGATVSGGLTLNTNGGPGGLLPNAIQTDGTGLAHYATGTLRDWASASPFSISGWFFFGDLLIGPGSVPQHVWTDDRVGTAATNNIEIRNGTAGTGRMAYITCNLNTFNSVTGDYTAGVWHHFAMSDSGNGASGTIAIYFDGTKIASTSSGASYGAWGSVQANFFTGDLAGNGLMNSGGRLAGIRCFNRVLADIDVSRMFTDKA